MPTNKDNAGPPAELVPWERNFRENLVRLREESGITQTQLARQLSTVWHLPFHQQTIQRIESGLRPVRLNEAVLIARALGTDTAFMMSAATPDSREMVFAVERTRRKARTIADDLGEMIGDLADVVTPLALEVHELLKNYRGEDPSPALVYGFTWANKIWDSYVHLEIGLNKLIDIAEGREVNEPYSYPEFTQMESWWDGHNELFADEEYPHPPSQSSGHDDSAS